MEVPALSTGQYPISHYARILRPGLPRDAFAPSPGRLLWLVVHGALAITGIVAITYGWGGHPALVGFTLLIGHSFAVMAFVAHETLHGSIVRNKSLRIIIGWIGFLPLTISPTHWIAWHNRIHHGHTMRVGEDPDAFPTLAIYRSSLLTRAGDHLTFGAGRLRGFIGLLIGFSTQSFSVLFLMDRQRKYLSTKAFALAIAETLAGLAVWATLAAFLGAWAFLWAYVVPMLIANAIVMAYIMSNHSLNPLTEINDPLLNSLSVTNPRILEILHLGFGMHVEHHLFPAMSPRHARFVRAELRDKFPDRYQTMSLAQAISRVFHVAHVYLDGSTLVDPLTGRTWPTLAPRDQR